MKRIICILLCVMLSAGLLVGCGLVDHNYERDYKQIIATIQPIEKDVVGKKIVLDQSGMPVVDEYGNIEKEDVSSHYESQKIDIYKSQLVNYTDYYLPNDYQNTGNVNSSINGYMNQLIKNELLLIEADSLFDAGILYWTKAEIDDIQHSVYIDISNQIFNYKNTLLKADSQPEIPAKGGDPATDETTYPVMPAEKDDEKFSPAVITDNDGSYQWFDSWYTEGEWYITGEGYKNAFPGLYEPTLKDKSLAIRAFGNYIDAMIKSAENIIGMTSGQKTQIKAEIAEINRIRSTEGISYVYPYIGSTLMFKLMVGNQYIKNQKLTKLEAYITIDLTDADESDVTEYYNNLLKSQKSKFSIQANYDSAISDGDTILYTPSDRYVFVKHVLLPFSDEQVAELNQIKKQQGTNKDLIEQMRAELARNIVVYPHKDGENDLTQRKTVAQVTNEITGEMTRLKNDPYLAEREFDKFIYKYNTDPGAFNNETGYAIVYELGANESETYMTEFANAARAFRSNDKYNIGSIYYDDEMKDENGKPVPYIVTDYGIHIMYYLADPVAGEVKELKSYVTAGRHSYIYDLMKDAKLSALRSDAYSTWEARYVRENQNEYASIKTKLVDAYIKEIKKLIS